MGPRFGHFAVALQLLVAPGVVAAESSDVEIPMPGDPVQPPDEPTEASPAGPEIPMPGGAAPDTLDAAVDVVRGALGNTRGYVEDTLNLEYRTDKERFFLLNGARTRLSLAGKPSDNIDFSVSVVGLLYAGNTNIQVTPYLPDEVQAELFAGDTASGLPAGSTLLEFPLENRIYLQELFGTLYLPYVKVRVGRQKFYTGTGFAYNPIDLFNRKDPMDPTYEVDGIDALLVSFELPAEIEVQGLARFGKRLDVTDYLGRFKTSIGGWDVAAQYTHHIRRRIDWLALTSPTGVGALAMGASPETFERQFRWHLIAGEIAGEIFGIGVHAEGGYAIIEEKGDTGTLDQAAQDHERFLVGLDYTFDFELQLMAEYMRIGRGRQRSSEIDLNDRLALMTGEVLAIGSDTLFVGASYPLADLWEVAVYGIVNLNDPSAVINPWVRADLYENVKLSFTAYLPIGDQQSQLGKSPPGGFARLRFSF